ncbi:MAG: hypothetical protein NC191_03830 [Muribaculaceae bacterium]|nr:hypothetical protein [Muribaculaceae bacterium]
MSADDSKFIFNFPSRETRQQFKIVAVSLNKSMTQLLGEIVVDFLDKRGAI